jgi:carboxymethylenebutenolidase
MELENVVMDGVPGVIARPGTPPRAGVIVLQEAFGLTSHIRSICRRVAAEGYTAIAPALYHRDGAPVIDYSRVEEAMTFMAKLDVGEMESDIAASLAALRDEGFDVARTAILGFCMGGSVALYGATRFDLGAVVTFYGGGISAGRFGMPPLEELAPSIKCPWLGLYGEQDPTIPPDDIEALGQALQRSRADTRLVTYPEGGHGFNCDERPSFVASAAAAAWGETIAFLGERVSG